MRRYKALPIRTEKEAVDPIPLTPAFLDQIKNDYQAQKKLQVEVKERLKEAREKGDLSENGAYKYAKFELGNIGRKLQDLGFLLTNGFAQSKNNDGKIAFGAEVTLIDLTTDKTITYTLLSEYESDPSTGSISLKSPLGQALQTKKVGDKVTLKLPRGDKEYQIKNIT